MVSLYLTVQQYMKYVMCSSNVYNVITPAPKLSVAPSRNRVPIFELIRALGRAALIAEYILLLHSFFVNVHDDRRYFSFLLMFVCSAVHNYIGVTCPVLILPYQMTAGILSTFIIFCLFPLVAIHNPSISEASSLFSLFQDTLSPSTLVTTRSNPIPESLAIHFPLFHT